MIKHRARFFDGRIPFLSVALIVCAISFLVSAVRSSVIQARAEVNRDLANILSVVPVKPNPELTIEPTVGKSGIVTTRDGKYNAYVFCVPLGSKEDPERCAHRVYFDDYGGSAKPRATIYEIRGEPELEEVTRLINRLKWVDNYTLSYERWAGPRSGHRYVIDVRAKKQVTAYDLTNGLTRIEETRMFAR
jgi:hypothetical protein